MIGVSLATLQNWEQGRRRTGRPGPGIVEDRGHESGSGVGGAGRLDVPGAFAIRGATREHH